VLKVRDAESGGVMRIGGHAMTFQEPHNHNQHGEFARPGAFKRVVAEVSEGKRSLKMRNAHRTPVGVWDTAREDDIGLWVEGDIIDTAEGIDLAKLIRGKAVDGLSIGFDPSATEFVESDTQTPWGFLAVELRDVDVQEVSPTDLPSDTFANDLAELREMRALEHRRRSRRRRKPPLAPPKRIATRGAILIEKLEQSIEELLDDETPRADIIADMADAAGITPGTVGDILEGNIDCPPIDRLEGFAVALGVSVDWLMEGAEEDGCPMMDDEGEAAPSEGEADEAMRSRRRSTRRRSSTPKTESTIETIRKAVELSNARLALRHQEQRTAQLRRLMRSE
jgi:HK97 family phage prohead protease